MSNLKFKSWTDSSIQRDVSRKSLEIMRGVVARTRLTFWAVSAAACKRKSILISYAISYILSMYLVAMAKYVCTYNCTWIMFRLRCQNHDIQCSIDLVTVLVPAKNEWWTIQKLYLRQSYLVKYYFTDLLTIYSNCIALK